MAEQTNAGDPVVFDSGSTEMAVYADRIVVADRGLSSVGSGGREGVMLDRSRSIDWRDAGLFARGHLAFVGDQWGDTDYDAATVIFAKKSQRIWEDARRLIQSRLDAIRAQPERLAVAPVGGGGDEKRPDVMEQLRKLADL